MLHLSNPGLAHKAGNKTLYLPVIIKSGLVCVDADAANLSAIENLLTNNCEGGEWVINPPMVEIPQGPGLGITVDHEALKKYLIQQPTIIEN